MVTACKNWRVEQRPRSTARFDRQTPSEKQAARPNRLQSFYRARYYDVTTSEFTSRDPLEYVNGMSAYRGYFIVLGVDPSGLICKPDCTAATTPKNAYVICTSPSGAPVPDAQIPANEWNIGGIFTTIDNWIKDPRKECIQELRIKAHGSRHGDRILVGEAANPNPVTSTSTDIFLTEDNIGFFSDELTNRYCFCKPCRIIFFVCTSGLFGTKPTSPTPGVNFLDHLFESTGCEIVTTKGICTVNDNSVVDPLIDLDDTSVVTMWPYDKPRTGKPEDDLNTPKERFRVYRGPLQHHVLDY